MNSFIDVAKFQDNVVTRTLHNAPIGLSGFSEPVHLKIPIGNINLPNPSASAEYFWLVNMGDDETRPSLYISILNDRLPMYMAGDADPVVEFELKYGDACVVSQDVTGADAILAQYMPNVMGETGSGNPGGTPTVPEYVLPVATSSTIGGVKSNEIFQVNASGNVSIKFPNNPPTAPEYVLPVATSESIGGVKSNDVFKVDGEGNVRITSIGRDTAIIDVNSPDFPLIGLFDSLIVGTTVALDQLEGPQGDFPLVGRPVYSLIGPFTVGSHSTISRAPAYKQTEWGMSVRIIPEEGTSLIGPDGDYLPRLVMYSGDSYLFFCIEVSRILVMPKGASKLDLNSNELDIAAAMKYTYDEAKRTDIPN